MKSFLFMLAFLFCGRLLFSSALALILWPFTGHFDVNLILHSINPLNWGCEGGVAECAHRP